MQLLLIIVGVSNSDPNIKPQTTWSDHATIEACKQAGIIAERVIPKKGYTITGMSHVGHNPDNTIDCHFRTDGSWQ